MTWIDDRINIWKAAPPDGVSLPAYLGMTEELCASVITNPPKFILGIDEVGCGCWAGPLVVGAVLAPFAWSHPLLRDSKDTRKESRRGKILEQLPTTGEVRYFIRRTPPNEVDRRGIRRARGDAFTAICESLAHLENDVLVVIDGDVPARGFEQALLPKADTFVPHVMAASIVAKVSRDTEMILLAKQYPEYGFEKHKGYGGNEEHQHTIALKKYGPCPIHRRSFRPIQKYLGSSTSAPTPASGS
jgi:ribonuclease HII